jgi:hypothetical protein
MFQKLMLCTPLFTVFCHRKKAMDFQGSPPIMPASASYQRPYVKLSGSSNEILLQAGNKETWYCTNLFFFNRLTPAGGLALYFPECHFRTAIQVNGGKRFSRQLI